MTFWPRLGTLAALAISVVLLSLAMCSLPVGTVILGTVLFAELATAARLGATGAVQSGA